MISLEEKVGLPIKLIDNKLIFFGDFSYESFAARTLEEMRPVLYDKTITAPELCYYMYRGISFFSDTRLFREKEVSYDITMLPGKKFGKECAKTFGHFHPSVGYLTYPEVYEVILGKALFLFEGFRTGSVVVKAEEGDKVVVPPFFGHVLINSAKDVLVTGNLVANNFKNYYEHYKRIGGAMYFKVGKKFVANPNHPNAAKPIEKLRQINAKEVSELGLLKKAPLYASFVENPDAFNFLHYPEPYKKVLAGYLDQQKSSR
ncbi:glucose-6-phosphate isomerase [Candidatus Woesearchaeota archaeon]|nr:glucose-6-phosphate isomerase [Candidatus Woesearchaeota archaeon]